MQILFYQDDTLNLDLEMLSEELNKHSKGVEFSGFNQSLSIQGNEISHPRSYSALDVPLNVKLAPIDRVLIATKKRYDNNYFYDFAGNIGIFSFSGWEHLTDLPEINGLVYFACQLLSDAINFGEDHNNNTGCINDFLWDKRGVDVGMKSAFLCPSCKEKYGKRKQNTNEKKFMIL